VSEAASCWNFDNEEIRPGVRLGVEADHYDATIALAIEKRQLRLAKAAAEKIWVL
jgi:hypothetical protein